MIDHVLNNLIALLIILLLGSFVLVVAFSLAGLLVAVAVLGLLGWLIYRAGRAIRRWWQTCRSHD